MNQYFKYIDFQLLIVNNRIKIISLKSKMNL
jgi:hypothetical protein